MTTILALIAVSAALLLVFSDKIVGYYLPESSFAQLSEEIDDIIIHMDDSEDQRTAE